MLDDLALFIHIVDAGSLLAAATQLNLPPSTLTRRLQKLEQQLGCRLLHRNTRNNVPTHEGMLYYEQCRLLIHALKENVEHLDDTLNQIKGIIRVLAPVDLANDLLAPAWLSFMQRYPEIHLSLHLSNRIQNLIELNADLAIRVGKLSDSSLKMRTLGRISKMALVASPTYLEQYKAPQTPEALHQHHLIVSEPLINWELFHHTSGERFYITPSARFSVNELRLAINAACAGVGILLCPINLCYNVIQQGSLVHVLPDWITAPREITILWPDQKHVPARVRELIEHLASYVSKHPLLNTKM